MPKKILRTAPPLFVVGQEVQLKIPYPPKKLRQKYERTGERFRSLAQGMVEAIVTTRWGNHFYALRGHSGHNIPESNLCPFIEKFHITQHVRLKQPWPDPETQERFDRENFAYVTISEGTICGIDHTQDGTHVYMLEENSFRGFFEDEFVLDPQARTS